MVFVLIRSSIVTFMISELSICISSCGTSPGPERTTNRSSQSVLHRGRVYFVLVTFVYSISAEFSGRSPRALRQEKDDFFFFRPIFRRTRI